MKKLFPMVVAGACLAVTQLQAPLTAHPPARDSEAQKPPPLDKQEEFNTKFRQALEINAKDEVAKLVRAYTEQAMSRVIDLCGTLPNGGETEQAGKELRVLKEAWKTSYKSNFVDKIYNYFSLLEARASKELEKLNRQYDAEYKKYDENLSRKDPGTSDALASEFETIGKGYVEIGYQLFAARAFNLAGLNLDTPIRGNGADLNRAADAYGSCVKACEAWEINDNWALSVKGRFDALTRDGKGSAGGVAPGSAAPIVAAPLKTAEPITSAMHFEAVPNIETYVRPGYSLDGIYILWPVVNIREKGTSGNFQALVNKKVKIMRTGAAALMLDADGDDKPDKEVPASGNKALVQFQVGDGAEKRDWAFITEVGTDKESYEGVSVNFQPSDPQFLLYVMSAASMVGSLNNVPVRVFDDNMDGIYGSPPIPWQNPGLTTGSFQQDMDALLVGAEKHARPWSEFAEVGGTWYQFEPQKGGVEVKATPMTFECGKLKLDYKGEPPEYVIVQGTGNFEKSYFDLMQNGGAEVNVPVGKYQLFFGIVRKGKKQQMMKALILPGKRTPSWSVEAGKTVVIPLGAPFAYDFDTEIKDGKLTVKGPSVTVIGSASERYERLWNCVTRPELAWRKAGTKHASKPEKLGIVEDLNEKDEQGHTKHEFTDTYHPLDLSVEVKLKEGEGVEVQLSEKKNKLFGAIESIWKK